MASMLHISQPEKRRKYDEAFKAEALRLARDSCSARAAAQQLDISETLLYRWRQAQAVVEASSAAQGQDSQWRACEPKISAWSARWPL